MPEDPLLVLTAAPESGLPPALAGSVADAVAAGRPVWLSGSACEMAVSDAAALPRARQSLAGAPVDANLVPAGNRRKRVLIADMDSTIIPVECIDEIADFAGLKTEVAAITERAMAGELDFEAALRARVAMLAGLEECTLERVYAERISLNPGARTLVRTMAANGAATALVSGGFSYFTSRVAAAAGFAEDRANRLEIADGHLTGRVIAPILGREAKLSALRELVARLGVSEAEVLAVGDGANDLAMVEAAGLGVGFRPKEALARRADAVIRHGDLTALLHLQGYTADEFVID